MKREELIDAIGLVEEDLIESARKQREAAEAARPLRKRKIIYSVLGACAVLAVTLLVGLPLFFHGTGRFPANKTKGSLYVSYTSPVFPLTADKTCPDVAVSRSLQYDFSSYLQYRLASQGGLLGLPYTQVQDEYLLQNRSSEEQAMKLRYPLALSLQDAAPSFSLGGVSAAPALHVGDAPSIVSGGKTISLQEIADFSAFEAALSTCAGAAPESFSPGADTPVILYRIEDVVKEAEGNTSVLSLECSFVTKNTIVLSFGFDNCLRETGGPSQYYLSLSGAEAFETEHLLIVIGDDLTGCELKAYRDSSLKEEADIIGSITRSEGKLGKVLLETALPYWTRRIHIDSVEQSLPVSDRLCMQLSAEEQLRLILRTLHERRMLSHGIHQLSQSGNLEEIYYNVLTVPRILYAEIPVHIPAGASLHFAASFRQTGSRLPADRGYKGSADIRDLCFGYDMTTQLGSILSFEAEKASVRRADLIRMTDQNFGFDPDRGISEVELDLSVPYYYMNILPRQDIK